MVRVHRTLTLILVALSVSAATHPIPAHASRNGRDVIGLRGHGFVRDAGGNVTTIDVRRATSFTIVFGINTNGEMVGGYVDAKGATHGLLRRGNEVTTIDVPGAEGTFAFRANDVGQIVGAYGNDANVPAFQFPHGFLLDRDSGAFTKIDVPGAIETRPFGINNEGQIVGEYVDDAGRSHGFLLDNGVYIMFDAPDGASIWPTDIDDRGRIVGTWFSATGVRGFLRDAQGAFTPIEAPAAPPPPERPELPTTQVFGINNLGQITGVVNDFDGVRSFLLDNGVFTTVEAPEAIGKTLALDVSDDGRIVGAFDLETHGYVRDTRERFTAIDHPEAVTETVPTGINRRGQVVGAFIDATNTIQNFVFDGARFIEIEIPGALGSGATKINDRGQVVGSYSTLTNRNHAANGRGYLWDRGRITLIDVPGAQATAPFDINNRGEIAGWYADVDGVFHGFLRDGDGALTTIDVPGAVATLINGINDRGQMTGEYLDASGIGHGFVWDDGAVTTIDAPGASIATVPWDINNAGVIVGAVFDDTRVRGFILKNGRFTTLAAPGAFFDSFPWAIDDRGRIVGYIF